MENYPDRHCSLLTQKSCLICYESVELSSQLLCEHDICKLCLKEYLETKISEGSVLNLKCPAPKCSNLLSEDFIISIISVDFHQKFKLFLENKNLEQNPQFRWCPMKNCSGYDCRKDLNILKLICNKCNSEFCYLCADIWHEDGKCNILSDQKNSKSWTKTNDLKFCPNCFCITQKNGGCPMIKCSKCSEMWCWICGESFKNHDVSECFLRNKRFGIYEIFILMMIFFPIVYPFMIFIIFIMIFVFEDAIRNEGGFEGFDKVIKYKYFVIFSSFVISPVFVLLATALFPIIYGISIPFYFVIHRREETTCSSIFCYLCMFLVAPLLIGVMYLGFALGFCILPIVGLGLLIAKIYFLLSNSSA